MSIQIIQYAIVDQSNFGSIWHLPPVRPPFQTTALEPGDVVVLRGAISDEGTSRHYFGERLQFGTSTRLTKKLESSLKGENLDYVLGDAWTTDAPYRETVAKMHRFRKMGARIVNMESSAIFAVASYRGTDVASVQIVSDIVSEKQWNPAFHHEVVEKRRNDILAAVLQAIKG